MEQDLKPQAKLEDDTASQVSTACLGTPVILREVLQQFSNSELVKLSLVNKQWNYEARSVMRERGNLRANLSIGARDEDDPCRKLVAFASDLKRMRVVPFTGLHTSIYHRGGCKPFPIEVLDQSYKVVLDRLPWKHFSVRFFPGSQDSKDCPALRLVKFIFVEHCVVLEELTFDNANEEFLQNIFQDRNMPCLKSLKLESGYSSSADQPLPSTFIKGLVSCAPNLRFLYVDRTVDLMVNVLEGSSAVLVPQFRFHPLLKPICEGLIGSLRATAMEILIQKVGTGPELLNRFIPLLLDASRTTITNFRMDLLFAVPLMCYGICLGNVTKLQIHINYGNTLEEIPPSILKLAKGLDFTRVFPKLNQVKILDHHELSCSSDVVGAFVEQGNAVLTRGLPDRAINIKILKIDEMCFVKTVTLVLLAQMFPDVTTVHTRALQRLPFTLLREQSRSGSETGQTCEHELGVLCVVSKFSSSAKLFTECKID